MLRILALALSKLALIMNEPHYSPSFGSVALQVLLGLFSIPAVVVAAGFSMAFTSERLGAASFLVGAAVGLFTFIFMVWLILRLRVRLVRRD